MKIATLIFCSLLSIPLSAEETKSAPPVKPEETKSAPAVKPEESKIVPDGWSKTLGISANISLGSNKDVVGQTSGDTYTYGGQLGGKYNYKDISSEWRNSLNIQAKTSKTPAIDKYLKAEDELKIESLYLKKLTDHPKLGPYGKASAQTNMFTGEDLRSSTATYTIIDKNGNTVRTTTGNMFRLADPFGVTTLKQSVGLYVLPYKSDQHKMELRFGIGAVQVLSNDQYSVTKEKDDNITISEINPVDEQGAEFALTLEGKFDDKTTYIVAAEALYPFSPDKQGLLKDKADVEFVSVDYKMGLTTKLYEWADIKYEYKAVKQIQTVDAWQITHGLVINIKYNLL